MRKFLFHSKCFLFAALLKKIILILLKFRRVNGFGESGSVGEEVGAKVLVMGNRSSKTGNPKSKK